MFSVLVYIDVHCNILYTASIFFAVVAGDAILVFWKIEDYDHLLKLVKSVIECSCTIQKKYGTWNAEGITTLRVKIGLFSFFVRYMLCSVLQRLHSQLLQVTFMKNINCVLDLGMRYKVLNCKHM